MVDDNALTLAFRNRMLTLVVATTGSQTLSATATGYARTAGSFLADGFADGMEFTPAGFADLTTRVIDSVSALAITTTTAPTVEAPAAGRTLAVGIPITRGFENKRVKPVGLRPYIEEGYVPGTSTLLTLPAQNGVVEEAGLYVVKWYGLEDKGTGGIRRPVNTMKALFAPGTVVFAGGIPVRVRGDATVKSSQILPQGNGWAVCTVTIPWRALSQNLVAA